MSDLSLLEQTNLEQGQIIYFLAFPNQNLESIKKYKI